MTSHAHDDAQTAAIEAGDDATAIVGPPGSGKSTTLVERAARIARTRGTTLLCAPSDTGVARLRRLTAAEGGAVTCRTFGDVAFDIVADARATSPAAPATLRSDDVRASLAFERAGAELFSLSWTEFAEEIDPEITGLRTPERFSAAAFRLIRKLRASLVTPGDFRRLGLRGATEFYAKLPNLASADLIMETPAKYRDSLRATPSELARQHEREVDLVKILARLYATYAAALAQSGALTPIDAVYEAVYALRADTDLRERTRARYAAALVDDAQDLTLGQLALLEAIFGSDLRDVTLAGDGAQSTRGFATGARGNDVFKRAAVVHELAGSYRCDSAIERVARRALESQGAATSLGDDERVTLYRADTVRDEARFVTAEIEALVRDGMRPERIAVVLRGLACAHTYVDALLARNVPVDVAGAGSIYDFPIVLDALAVLWCAIDPYRHDNLLRVLEAPWLRLADASIATLCADASDPQPLLFDLPDDVAETTDRRWDRKRSLRLGRNVTRGDVDADMPDDARDRLVAFRAARQRWDDASRSLRPSDLARLILDESVLATLRPGARGRFDAHLIDRLLDDVDAFTAREPLGTLEDFLAYAESASSAEADLLGIGARDGAAVAIRDVEAAKGDEFDAVFLVDVRAGAWPRYYVPDAFLFMPGAGMIPKENVGDAEAGRTAKFTHSLFRYKVREKYNAEERRAFYCAATRARTRLFVSASGRATRGVSAPEILEELRR